MSFYQKPNYNYLRRLLRDALANMPAEEDNIFDWSEPIRPIRLTQNDREAYFPISPKPLRAKLWTELRVFTISILIMMWKLFFVYDYLFW